MFALGSKPALRAAATIFAAIVAVITLSTEASAIDGRTAVGRCIDGPARCAWAVNKKGEVDICTAAGCITCPSATGDCKPAREGRPRPTTVLPVGTEVITTLGSFKIQRGTTPIPAAAADGKTAVGRCIDSFASGMPCAWSVSHDGSIDICASSECVTCASATGTCTTARKGRPRPTTALPVGTKVITVVGSFRIRRR